MKKNKGFTLVEVLIVIAIIGILMGIALPSYQKYVQKGNRVAALLTLSQLAQQFERNHARQGIYPATISETAETYTFTVARTDDTFTLTATPIGASVGDECGTLTINQAGVTTSSGSSGCWD